MSKVYVRRDLYCGGVIDEVSLPLTSGGVNVVARNGDTVTLDVCYREFHRITGIKLNLGVLTQVEIKGKVIEEIEGSPTK